MNKLLLALFSMFFFTVYSQKPAVPSEKNDSRDAGIKSRLDALEKMSGGNLGVAVIHLESGKRFSKNSQERFPMASTFKVALAVKLLTLVDSGKLSLHTMVTLKRSDLHPGSELTDYFRVDKKDPGIALSIRNLMEYMLLASDNSATDICLNLVGGPKAVTSKMKQLGLTDMQIGESTLESNIKSAGINPPKNADIDMLDSLEALVPKDQQQKIGLNWVANSQNKTTPEEMSRLLEKIYHGTLLSAESNALLINMMTRCMTGSKRIKGLLPVGTVVWHKTGSQLMTVNDVGVVTLPDNRGHFIIAVYITKSNKSTEEMERVIAETARLFYDLFSIYQPG